MTVALFHKVSYDEAVEAHLSCIVIPTHAVTSNHMPVKFNQPDHIPVHTWLARMKFPIDLISCIVACKVQ